MTFIRYIILVLCLPAILFPTQLRTYEIAPPQISHQFNTKIPSFPCTLEEMFAFLEQIDHDEFWECLTETEFLDILEFLRTLAHWGTDLRDLEAHQALDEEYDEILRMYYEDRYDVSPTSFYGKAHIELCGGVFYCIKKIGRHFKRNKKEYIIGTVIVVGIAVGCYALAVPAAAALSSDSDHKDKSSSAEPTSAQEIMQETIIAYQEEISTAIDQVPDTPSLWSIALQNTKEVGAYFAHEILDEVARVISLVPTFMQEVQSFAAPQSNFAEPLENHYDTVSKGHQIIDNAFATNQSSKYTQQAKETHFAKDFTKGELPLPGGLNKSIPSSTKGFVGKKGWELKNHILQRTRHNITKINGRTYRGHALDQMQNRGIPPSAVDNAIHPQNKILKDIRKGTAVYYDNENKIKVILNDKGEVITVIRTNK